MLLLLLLLFPEKEISDHCSLSEIRTYLPISSKLIDNSFVRYNDTRNYYKPDHLLYKYYVYKLE